ncbi:MAG: hypothetical protein CSA50_06880 [Gammaproteobacteria bacterium]|nr:MAG: hypothetical protein CSA50_06880 [Gammaproteobacteria bacterium]
MSLRSRFAETALFGMLLATVFCSGSALCRAEANKTPIVEQIYWHGFVSQSFILTDENEFLGSSSDGSFKFSSAGLGALWQPMDSVQLSIQGLYKQIGNSSPKGTQLDYAILDWAMVDEFDYGLGFRVGRLMNPYGFFNETRDVAATRPSLLLPESVYIDYLQFLFRSSDSVGLYMRRELSEGTFSFNANFGKPLLTDEATHAILGGLPGRTAGGNLVSEEFFALQLRYEDASGKWRSALSYGWFAADYRAAPDDILADARVDFKHLMLSLEYSLDDF